MTSRIAVHSFLSDEERLAKVKQILVLDDEREVLENKVDLIGLQKFYRYKEISKVRGVDVTSGLYDMRSRRDVIVVVLCSTVALECWDCSDVTIFYVSVLSPQGYDEMRRVLFSDAKRRVDKDMAMPEDSLEMTARQRKAISGKGVIVVSVTRSCKCVCVWEFCHELHERTLGKQYESQK